MAHPKCISVQFRLPSSHWLRYTPSPDFPRSPCSLESAAITGNALCDPLSPHLFTHSFLIWLLPCSRFPPDHRPCVFTDPNFMPSNKTGIHPDTESYDLHLFFFFFSQNPLYMHEAFKQWHLKCFSIFSMFVCLYDQCLCYVVIMLFWICSSCILTRLRWPSGKDSALHVYTSLNTLLMLNK